MIKLINNVSPMHGLAVYLNPDHIVSVFEEPEEEGGTLKTKIFCAAGGLSWTYCVEESPGQVAKLLRRYREGYYD